MVLDFDFFTKPLHDQYKRWSKKQNTTNYNENNYTKVKKHSLEPHHNVPVVKKLCEKLRIKLKTKVVTT